MRLFAPEVESIPPSANLFDFIAWRDLGFDQETSTTILNIPFPPSAWPPFHLQLLFGSNHLIHTAGRFIRISHQGNCFFPRFLGGLTPILPPYLFESDTPFAVEFSHLHTSPVSLCIQAGDPPFRGRLGVLLS